MEHKHIDILLEKYWQGETDLTEEKILKTYFQKGKISPEHVPYQAFFQLLKEEASIQYKGTMPLREQNWRKNIFAFSYWKLAASVILLVGMITMLTYSPAEPALVAYEQDTYEDPEVAYAEMQKAMQLVSKKLNQGKTYGLQLGKFGEITLRLKENK